MTPGERLREWRREQGWTVAQLAEEMECTPSAIWTWQSGRARPRYWRRVHLESLTGIPRDLWHEQHWRVRDASSDDVRRYWRRQLAGLCTECESDMDRVGALCEACLAYKRGGPRQRPRRGKRVAREPSWIEVWREMRRAS